MPEAASPAMRATRDELLVIKDILREHSADLLARMAGSATLTP